jgi:hypothetical protein
MPSVLIEVRQQYSKEQESAIMEAVHSALREAFRILPEDRNVRLVVHEPHRFECPPSRARPELYTLVRDLWIFGPVRNQAPPQCVQSALLGLWIEPDR